MSIQRAMKAVGFLLGLGSVGLHAQQAEGFQLAASIPYHLGSLEAQTHQTLMGLNVEGDYQGALWEKQVFYRLGGGVNYLPGKAQDGLKVTLTGLQAHADVVVPLGQSKRIALVTGLSINNYYRSASASDGSGDSGSVKHFFGKLGFRTGFEYQVTPQWSLGAMLQITELGSDNIFHKNSDPDFGNTPVNPSWVQFGARYTF